MRKRQRELVILPKLKLLPWLKLISLRLLDYIVSRKVNQQNQKNNTHPGQVCASVHVELIWNLAQ